VIHDSATYYIHKLIQYNSFVNINNKKLKSLHNINIKTEWFHANYPSVIPSIFSSVA